MKKRILSFAVCFHTFYITFLFSLLWSCACFSQNLNWAKSMGGAGYDVGLAITIDGSGNVYTTGWFSGTADFDPGPGTFNLSSAGGYDVFITKLDAFGNFLWARSMGGINSDAGYSIAFDAEGNIYTTGYYQGPADFDPGPGIFNLTSASGYNDIFISKLDPLGNFIWAKSINGANSSNIGFSIALDNSGNIYTTGNFQGTTDFDPGSGTFNLSSAGVTDIFICKLNASGNLLWAKSMGGANNLCHGYSIALDGQGNVYATGDFQGTADFDPGSGTFNLTSTGLEDIFISKLDVSGNLLWAKSMGGTNSDYGYSIALDSLGNVYTTGRFWGTVDFDPGATTFNLISSVLGDIFISKLDASGNFLWAKNMSGTNGGTTARSIALDGTGNVYTTGSFQGTADFDPGTGTFNLTCTGYGDIFISKLNTSGNFLWAKSMGGTGSTAGKSIAIDDQENIYVTGSFYGTSDFDPGAGAFNLTSAGSNDIFIVKLGTLVTNIAEENRREGIRVFPNPFSTQVVIQSNYFLQNARLTLNNCFGQTVLYIDNISGQTIVLNRDKLTSGIYYVRLTEENKTILIDKLIISDK